jgi:hypothetical protein
LVELVAQPKQRHRHEEGTFGNPATTKKKKKNAAVEAPPAETKA